MGYDPRDLVNRNLSFWLSLIHKEDYLKINQEFIEIRSDISAFMHGECNKMEYRIRHRNGHWLLVSHEQRAVKLDKSNLVVNLILDLTERKLLNDYLNFCSQQGTKREIADLCILNNDLEVSDREMEVLKLIGCGYSSKEIACKLFISNHTAISHRKNLIRKFGVKNTAQLIREASKMVLL